MRNGMRSSRRGFTTPHDDDWDEIAIQWQGFCAFYNAMSLQEISFAISC